MSKTSGSDQDTVARTKIVLDVTRMAEATPGLGHAVAAYRGVVEGDAEGAKEVARVASRNAAVVGAGLAGGAMCGLAAPACGGALAVFARAAWDAAESAAAGEDRGIVPAVKKLHAGEANADEMREAALELGAEAAKGAIAGAFAADGRYEFGICKAVYDGIKNRLRNDLSTAITQAAAAYFAIKVASGEDKIASKEKLSEEFPTDGK